jgi:hypothetical protein
MIIFKNIFSYALTYKAYDWIQENKTRATPVFNALATVQLIICLTSIPMCMFNRISILEGTPKIELLTLLAIPNRCLGKEDPEFLSSP